MCFVQVPVTVAAGRTVVAEDVVEDVAEYIVMDVAEVVAENVAEVVAEDVAAEERRLLLPAVLHKED